MARKGKDGKAIPCMYKGTKSGNNLYLFGKLQNGQNPWNIICKRKSDSWQGLNNRFEGHAKEFGLYSGNDLDHG